jgi:hypothetical protein
LVSIHTQHGPDCAGPPAEHAVSGFDEAVFLCRDHVMTGFEANGYGVVFLTPDHQLDFSRGEAVLSWDVSTAMLSTRDWWDVWLSPMEDHLQLAGEDWYPDLQGSPRRGLHVRTSNFDEVLTGFVPELVRDGQVSGLPASGTPIERRGVVPSFADRTTFELRVTRTSLRLCVPKIGFCPIDTTFADVGWDRAVVQFGHHSYNPSKDDKLPAARANTWHWDNVRMSSAVPFDILHTDRRVAFDGATPLRFDGQAGGRAYLRFSGYTPNGEVLEISTNGGGTWTPAHRQDTTLGYNQGHHASYLTPVPAGTSDVRVRARGGARGAQSGNNWYIRDITIFSNT